MHLFFSATYDDMVKETIKDYIGEYIMYPLKNEALILKGVK